MAEEKHLVLPITGMTCANCVAAVERNIKKENGVSSAVVNLSSERATVVFDPNLVSMQSVINRVERAGYGIASGEIELWVKRMSDDNDARRLEKKLAQQEGILSVSVQFTSQRARINFVPTVISATEIRQVIRSSGFEAVQADGQGVDVEAQARAAEIRQQRNLLIIGLIFAVPLFLISMGRDFGLLGMWAHAGWVNWLMFVLASPVQFYVGWQYYVGAYKALRNGSANMDVLVVMGSSAAYLYSIPVVLGLLPGHVYFETAAVIITLIKLGKFLEAKAKGRTSEAIKKLMNLKAKTARVLRDGGSRQCRLGDGDCS